jgi:hypothetical protein
MRWIQKEPSLWTIRGGPMLSTDTGGIEVNTVNILLTTDDGIEAPGLSALV